MAWQPKATKWDWRKFLTDEELAFMEKADKAESRIADARAEFERKYGRERSLIANRAIQRARYAARTT